MPNELAQAGNFRGRIVRYDLNEAESGSIAISILVAIDEIYHEEEWHDWREHEFEVNGSMWVVKKDGKLNKSQVEALMNHAGWNGDFGCIVAGTWQPIPIQVVVNPDEYKGQTRYRIEFINAYDRTPGGRGSNVDAAKAKSLQQKFGGELRAMVGNKSRNEAPPANGAPAKPNPGTAPAEKPVASSKKTWPKAASAPADDGIPF